MTRDEVVTLVLSRCGNRQADTNLRAAAELELKLVQTRLEEKEWLPWFLLSTQETAPLTIGEPRLRVPERFLLEYDEGALFLTNSAGDEVELPKEEYDLLRGKYLNTDPNTPETYALRGEYFYFFPTPNAEYPVRMVYFKGQPVLDTDIENRWTKHAPHLLVAELGVVIAGQYTNDAAKKDLFVQQTTREENALMKKHEARDMANRELQMGGPT
jgi:hypothetical protein